MATYDFGTGSPDPGSFPSAGVADAAVRVLERDGPSLVEYPGAMGFAPLREIAVERFRRANGVTIPLGDVALTSGSKHAIGLCTQAMVSPGDTVVTEELSYDGSLGCFRRFGAEVVGVPLDGDGMRPDALADTLERLDREGRRPAFVYVIVTNQNPTGILTPTSRRAELLDVTRSYEVPILEDDCYADLLFDHPAPQSMYAMDPSAVIHLGSFSKILGPGFRLGYVAAQRPQLERILYWRTDGGTSAFAARVAAEFFRDNLWTHVETVNRVLAEKLAVATDAIDAHPEAFVERTHPHGGLFVWMRLPDDVDPREVSRRAAERGVVYGEGRDYHAHQQDVPNLRVAYGHASIQDLREGIPVLASCVVDATASRRAGVTGRQTSSSR